MDHHTEGNGDDDEVIITVPADMQAGVWANWAAINESDHEFRESLLSPIF